MENAKIITIPTIIKYLKNFKTQILKTSILKHFNKKMLSIKKPDFKNSKNT